MIKNPEQYEDNLKTSQNTSAGNTSDGSAGGGGDAAQIEELKMEVMALQQKLAAAEGQ
jgi:hypothetical protein